MTFVLKLLDRNGNALEMGDIVRISDGNRFTFYSEVTYLEKDKAIAPFHTFCFHSFEKVDSVPPKAHLSNSENRYKIWYILSSEADEDKTAALYEKYLLDWRACERLLEEGCFQIDLV